MMGFWSKRNSGITVQTNGRWHLSESISHKTHIWRIWPMGFLRGTWRGIQQNPNLKSSVPENEETGTTRNT